MLDGIFHDGLQHEVEHPVIKLAFLNVVFPVKDGGHDAAFPGLKPVQAAENGGLKGFAPGAEAVEHRQVSPQGVQLHKIKQAPPRQSAPRPASAVRHPAQKSGKAGNGITILIVAALIVSFVSVFVPLLEGIFDRPEPQPEYFSDGILYWVAEGEVSDEEAEILDDLVLEYNLEHDAPDMDEVQDYLAGRADEIPFGVWIVGDDGDGDVCLIVYP